jgi:hypothetical protein
MKKISFIGSYDKTDLILYIAKVLVALGKSVIVIDSTMSQKAKYIVPVIKPTKAYVTEFEEIEVAVGFSNFEEIKEYLGLTEQNELPYDIALIDIDDAESIKEFNINNECVNYFVTGIDLYSLKKGLEILSGLEQILKLTKVMFSRDASPEEDEYLNYLSLGYKIDWSEERIYFPFEIGDQTVIAENQRVAKIKFKNLSSQYKESLLYIVEQISEKEEYSALKRIFKQLEKGV